ncbi:hypothetical protein LCGC14_0384400 [marine sediment metagenome]|uniref:Portal protein n=1 Tax=marine sediment metagenome TaxID=412755 RepID=A0A0F9VNK9_9ZZZZ
MAMFKGDKLAKYIVDDLFKWFRDERSEQLEPQMRRNYDAFRGKYNSDALKKWRATEGNDWRSRVFVRLTKQKVFTYFNQVMAILLQDGKMPWDLEPSPIPQDRAGAVLNPDEAKRRSEGMKRQIDDDFTDARASRTMLSSGLEGAIYGYSWIRSPVMRPHAFMGVKFGVPGMQPLYFNEGTVQEFGRHSMAKQTRLRPVLEGPGVWNVFWDLETPDHQKGHGVILRDMMSKGRFLDLQDLPGYDAKTINELVSGLKATDDDTGEEDDSEGPIRERLNKRRRVIPVYTMYGRVPLKELQDQEKRSGQPIRGLNQRHEREVEIYTVCAGVNDVKVIRQPVLNPLTYRPMHLAKWQDLPHEPAGVGTPEDMEDSQMVMNGLTRAMLDNKAISSNLLLYWNPRFMAPGQNKSLYPGKAFEVEEGVDDVRQAMQFYSPPDNTRGTPDLINLFRDFADNETGVSRTQDGQLGPANRTAFEMAKVAEAGNKMVAGTLRNVDDGHVEPVVLGQYHYHMMTGRDESIKGDFKPVATGYQTFVNRNKTTQDLLGQLQLSLATEATMRFTKVLHFLRDIAKTNGLDPDRYYPSEEEEEVDKQIEMMVKMLPGVSGQGSPEGAAPVPVDGNDL